MCSWMCLGATYVCIVTMYNRHINAYVQPKSHTHTRSHTHTHVHIHTHTHVHIHTHSWLSAHVGYVQMHALMSWKLYICMCVKWPLIHTPFHKHLHSDYPVLLQQVQTYHMSQLTFLGSTWGWFVSVGQPCIAERDVSAVDCSPVLPRAILDFCSVIWAVVCELVSCYVRTYVWHSSPFLLSANMCSICGNWNIQVIHIYIHSYTYARI